MVGAGTDGEAAAALHTRDLDLDVEHLYLDEQDLEQELEGVETEAVEAAADANSSISIAVAAVRAALHKGTHNLEERMAAARKATRNSVATIAMAKRAVETAGEAMGVDLRPKPTRVKHWPEAPAITDIWRSTDATGSEGRTNNSDMDSDMEALSPTRRPPTRLKRGRRRNGEWGGSCLLYTSPSPRD